LVVAAVVGKYSAGKLDDRKSRNVNQQRHWLVTERSVGFETHQKWLADWPARGTAPEKGSHQESASKPNQSFPAVAFPTSLRTF
jgi:hypothetical protein